MITCIEENKKATQTNLALCEIKLLDLNYQTFTWSGILFISSFTGNIFLAIMEPGAKQQTTWSCLLVLKYMSCCDRGTNWFLLSFQNYEKGKSHMTAETECGIKPECFIFTCYKCSKQDDIVRELLWGILKGSDGFGNVKKKTQKTLQGSAI